MLIRKLQSATHKPLKAMLFTKPSLLFKLQQLQRYPSISYFNFFCTSTFDPQSFTVSYLINNCGFTPQTALKASQTITLHNSQKPDSVLQFLKTHGYSNSQISDILRRELWILSCDPNKVLLPKFQFYLSKGASSSEIVHMVNASPRILRRSLRTHIIPTFEFVRTFLESDKQTIACINRFRFVCSDCVINNVKMLIDGGMSKSKIAMLFRIWPRIYCSPILMKTVEELKQLGFNTSTASFGVALLAKISVNKTKWAEKVETYKKWGWSDQQIIQAFKKHPFCMLSSTHKINAVMSFWVDSLGWDSSDLVKAPVVIQCSLEKRVIPRAAVLQFLVSKGLRKKNAALSAPFSMSEKMFLEKFVKCFKDDSSHLLKLYEEKMNLANNMEKSSSRV